LEKKTAGEESNSGGKKKNESKKTFLRERSTKEN